MTPGSYLKYRRQAAGLTIADVAARVATEPRVAEHLRREMIALIEADVQPLTFTTVVALRVAFSFDLDILFALELGRLVGIADTGLKLCRICACSERDACRTVALNDPVLCHWVEPDLCSACAGADEPAMVTA